MNRAKQIGMNRAKQIGINRASMRSSKRVKHRLKGKLRSASTKPSSKIIKRRGKINKKLKLKDSIKLKKAHMKSRIFRKVCMRKKTKNNGKKDKENIVNGVQSLKNKRKVFERKPFGNVELDRVEEEEGKVTPFKLKDMVLARKSPFMNLEARFKESPEKDEVKDIMVVEIEDQEEMVIEIEAKSGDDKVTQFYSDILKYITSDKANISPDNYFHRALFPPKYRRAYISWLMKMHKKFDLKERTFFLAVNIIDRYLSNEQIKKSKLRVLVCASLLIASKYEEILFNELRDYQIMSNYEFTKTEFLAMEGEVLKVLDFKIIQTCHISICEIIRKFYNLDDDFIRMVTYVMKLGTLDDVLSFKKSSLVTFSACHFIIRKCYPFIDDKEISTHLEENRLLHLTSIINKMVLENSFNSSCTLRESLGKRLLSQVESSSI